MTLVQSLTLLTQLQGHFYYCSIPPQVPPTYPHIEMNIVYVLHMTWSSGQQKLTLFQRQEMLTVLQGHLMNHSIPPPPQYVINLCFG